MVKYDKAKFKFEQYIVFNLKGEMAYLYLSKIFMSLIKNLEEQNLKTVILLNLMKKQLIIWPN